MASKDLPALEPAQKRWALAAACLFLVGIGFLGFSLNTGIMRPFAIGWVALQIFGYVGAIRMAKGDFAHQLFKSQIMLHVMAVLLLVVVMVRAFQ
ncbi:pyridoxal phosphate biosynthetic protein [Erythrobacter longus]|uniref:Pyridoxal phosphate biosynthetic protein n=1 Tax=Erythrobacter longus TaxID=1044 RepID=A0A074MYU7_ERYLO|nr:hypothetical protein [Erythrobacter longus]KEO90827.1 pyridoxal phosphate biosynthetic protein [Erythrobacter longus]